MARPERFKPEEVSLALVEQKGIVSAAALKLKCSRRTVQKYIKHYASVREAAHEADETMKDFTEQMLYKNIAAAKEASIFFYLKCKARDRGYIERIRTENFNLNWNNLTTEQLMRLAAGEDPADVTANPG
jgi:predicted transcriptional regulator